MDPSRATSATRTRRWGRLALVEGVANGTTTFGDYETPMNDVVRSHARMGNRAVVCGGISELNFANREEWLRQGWRPGDSTPLDAAHGQRTLEDEPRLYDEWNGFDAGRIRTILGLHAADFLLAELLPRVQREARQRDTLMRLRVAQDPWAKNATLARAGLHAVPYLDSIGLLVPGLIAVRLSTATPEEVELVAQRGARMICCSNLIGVIDGVVPPAWHFARLGGVVGSLEVGKEVGKEAEQDQIGLMRPPLAPVVLRSARNLTPNLVYAETAANVVMTMVAGQVIYQDSEPPP